MTQYSLKFLNYSLQEKRFPNFLCSTYFIEDASLSKKKYWTMCNFTYIYFF